MAVVNRFLPSICAGLCLLLSACQSLQRTSIADEAGPSFQMFPDSTPGLIALGDSIMVGTGTDSPGSGGLSYNPLNARAFETLLANEVGGTNSNAAYGGSQLADAVTEQLFAGQYSAKKAGNPLVIENAGLNELLHCEDGGGIVAGCRANAAYAQRTLDTWLATTNISDANTWTATGVWSSDVRLAALARMSTVSGSSLSTEFTVQPNTAGLCVAWEAMDGNGGAASLTLNGTLTDTLRGFGNSGQTVKTGFVGSAWTVWTQCYPVVPGNYTVAVTITSPSGPANVFAPVAVLSPDDPTQRTAGSPRVISMGVTYEQSDGESAATAFYNVQKRTVAASLARYGFPVIFDNVRGYVDAAYDMSSNTVTKPDGTVCVASTAPPLHPNDCGHADLFRSLKAIVQP